MSIASLANPAANPQQLASMLSRLSDQELPEYAQAHQDDMMVVSMVMAEQSRRQKQSTAMQGDQPQPMPVRDQVLSQGLPEDSGIAQLPAPNMQNMAGGGIVAFSGEKDSDVKGDPLYLSRRDQILTPEEMLLYLDAQKKAAEPDNATIGSVLSRGLGSIGTSLGENWERLTSAFTNRPSQVGGTNVRFAPTSVAAANAPIIAPIAPRGAALVEPQTELPLPPERRPSGLNAAASALKLPDFGSTTPQSISDIAKEAEPFMAKRRAENAALLKPEQEAVDALHASIAESKKGDVKQQLLGIAAGFLSSQSPYFAQSMGDAVTNYMNISKEQKKFNADAVKEATAAQTALARYKVALDKGDEATAAKYKEIADNKADRAMGHQLQGLQIGIAAKQADTQAAHYGTMSDIARQRLKMAETAGSHDIKVGQEFTKLQKMVSDRLAKDSNYTLATPEQQEIMMQTALQQAAKEHPLLRAVSGNIGFSSGETGNIREGSL